MMPIDSENDFSTTTMVIEKTVFFFHAQWNGACLKLPRLLQKMAQEYSEWVFCTIDVDKLPILCENRKVVRVPTIQVYQSGERIAHIEGAKMDELCEVLHKQRQESVDEEESQGISQAPSSTTDTQDTQQSAASTNTTTGASSPSPPPPIPTATGGGMIYSAGGVAPSSPTTSASPIAATASASPKDSPVGT
eukprot:TRINITY_DN60763_c0_g1_i1.p1 TRINITY_DN60763_c0_g1~~TRINITY_DN60763_c0_g1_i1.p1  ORF type:complete len:192 (-),score=18.85 TRINITY_DN60763_c0_g1_i1:238-813(-)